MGRGKEWLGFAAKLWFCIVSSVRIEKFSACECLEAKEWKLKVTKDGRSENIIRICNSMDRDCIEDEETPYNIIII